MGMDGAAGPIRLFSAECLDPSFQVRQQYCEATRESSQTNLVRYLSMSSPSTDLMETLPKALTFDVFGTVVNWRKTVTSTLIYSATAKVSSSSRSAEISPEVRKRLSELTDESWGQFAQQWRDAYKVFVKGYKPNEDPWRDIDTHHRLSLTLIIV